MNPQSGLKQPIDIAGTSIVHIHTDGILCQSQPFLKTYRRRGEQIVASLRDKNNSIDCRFINRFLTYEIFRRLPAHIRRCHILTGNAHSFHSGSFHYIVNFRMAVNIRIGCHFNAILRKPSHQGTYLNIVYYYFHFNYCNVNPPSITNSAPVVNPDASLNK